MTDCPVLPSGFRPDLRLAAVEEPEGRPRDPSSSGTDQTHQSHEIRWMARYTPALPKPQALPAA